MLNLKPQVEEDIEIAEWLMPTGVKTVLKDSYPTIRMVYESLTKLDFDPATEHSKNRCSKPSLGDGAGESMIFRSGPIKK
jgi:hypothetical protein